MVTREQFEQHIKESSVSWGGSHKVMRRLIEERGLSIGAEIGIGYGGNSESMLGAANLQKLYGIDPFMHMDHVSSVMNVSQEDFDDIHRHVVKKLATFGDRYSLIRKASVEASREVPDELDFVYIDGDHSYQGAFDDLCAWSKKVKMGGIIAGHDYNLPGLPGVTKAIDEFFRRFGWEIHTEDNYVWWVEKKPLNISFFIPTYNYGKSIREAVESIMRDNFTPGDELIIFNDGSTDDTVKHLTELHTEYPEIRILSHKKNRGPSATRNDAVEACRNPLVFSHDHDNVLVPGNIAKLKDFMVNIGADIASFGELHYFVDKPNEATKTTIYTKGPHTLESCLAGNHFPGASGNYLFTKESWLRAGGYPDSWLDSWGFGIRQVATGSKMFALPNTFYWHQYRHSHGYESTYIKGVRTGRISSLAALQILIPFLKLLDKKSANHITSEQGRETWFEHLAKQPLIVRFNTLVEYNDFLEGNFTPSSPLKKKLQRIKNQIKRNPQGKRLITKLKSLRNLIRS